jgi:cytochrome c-type biogenesis protein CcsB
MSAAESIFYWLAAVLLAAAFFFSLAAIVFKRRGPFGWSLNLSLGGLVLITAFGILRWVAAGHPPFVTRFESMVITVWFILGMFHMPRIYGGRIEILSMPSALVSFILLGWASSMETQASPLSSALENVWLFIHATFATLGASAFLISACYGAIYLLGPERHRTLADFARRLPEYTHLPRSVLNFMIFGLILWGVMIVSGSIWANAAWGRYWAWDPIELWSLISWLSYGLVLHARLTFRLSQRKFSWLAIICALTVIFALWGVGYIYETIHNYG